MVVPNFQVDAFAKRTFLGGKGVTVVEGELLAV
jgi:hypothetical protein